MAKLQPVRSQNSSPLPASLSVVCPLLGRRVDIYPGLGRVGKRHIKHPEEKQLQRLPLPGRPPGVFSGKGCINGDTVSEFGPSRNAQKREKKGLFKAEAFQVLVRWVQELSAAHRSGGWAFCPSLKTTDLPTLCHMNEMRSFQGCQGLGYGFAVVYY